MIIRNNNQTIIDETNESTNSSSVTNTQNNIIQFNIPVKYWEQDTSPAINIKIFASELSVINKEQEISPVLQLTDGSTLTFEISHYAETVELDEENGITIL